MATGSKSDGVETIFLGEMEALVQAVKKLSEAGNAVAEITEGCKQCHTAVHNRWQQGVNSASELLKKKIDDGKKDK